MPGTLHDRYVTNVTNVTCNGLTTYYVFLDVVFPCCPGTSYWQRSNGGARQGLETAESILRNGFTLLYSDCIMMG
jgi:hypothetical protein